MTAALAWPGYEQEIGDPFTAPRTHVQPHTDYQTRPLDWIADKLDVPRHTLLWSLNAGYDAHEWDGTEDPMAAVLDALVAYRNVGVESATTTGKTFLGACLTLWFVACHKDALVVTVAPKQDQLELHLWKEIGRLWPRFQRHFPDAERTHLRIRMVPGSDEWGAVGFVAGVKADEVKGSATKAQGFHAEHMLIVLEETPGIHSAILTAFKNTCRAPHNLRVAFGNPDHQLDALHTFCQGARTDHVIVSAYDHPNVVTGDDALIPGAVSRQGIADALEDAEDDGGADNPFFKSRVRGISPAESVMALIRLTWLEAAARRYKTPHFRQGQPALGVDVANSEHGDKGAISFWRGACLLQVEAFPCPNANLLGDRVHGLMAEHQIHESRVGVDKGGVGAGTVNELTRLGATVQALDSGTKSAGEGAEKYLNLRAHMWWTFREDARLGRLAMAYDRELFRELTMVQYETRLAVIRVEAKEEIKKRLSGKSPDRADAVVYGNWVRDRSEPVALPPRGEDIHPGFVMLGRRVVVNEGRAGRMAAEQHADGGGFKVPGTGWRVPR